MEASDAGKDSILGTEPPVVAPAAQDGGALALGGDGKIAPGAGVVLPTKTADDPGLALDPFIAHKSGDLKPDEKTPAKVEPKAPDAKTDVKADAAGSAGTDAKDAKSDSKDAKATAPDGKTPDSAVAGDYSQLVLPDGYQTSDEAMTQFREFAAKVKLTPEAAQAVIDFDATRQKAAFAAHEQMIARQDTEWVDAIRKDTELGGDKLLPNLQAARKAIHQFGSEPLRTFLKTTGLDNHPELVRAFARVGLAMADDRTDAPAPLGGRAKPAFDDYGDLYPELQGR